MTEPLWTVISHAIDALSPVLLAAFSWLSVQIAAYIDARVRNEKIRAALRRLDDGVFVAVREVEQVLVVSLKTASADGALNPEERIHVKTAAAQAVRSYFGSKGWLELGLVLGLSEPELERMLSARVEAAVYELRSQPEHALSNVLRTALKSNGAAGGGPHSTSGANGSA